MKISIFAIMLFATICTAADAKHPSTAEDILTRMKAACGGDAWNQVQGWHETGVVEVQAGQSIQNEVWHDMRSLKTAIVGKMNGQVARRAGFDGVRYWLGQTAGRRSGPTSLSPDGTGATHI